MNDLDQDREQRIRERAHALWEQEGRPEGRREEHWRRATEEIDRETLERADENVRAAGGGETTASVGSATRHHPGGTAPDGGPAPGAGRLGGGGGHTAGAATGDARRDD